MVLGSDMVYAVGYGLGQGCFVQAIRFGFGCGFMDGTSLVLFDSRFLKKNGSMQVLKWLYAGFAL